MEKELGVSVKYLPYILFENDKVAEAGYGFLDLTGYDISDILDKTSRDMERILRSKFIEAFNELNTEVSCYIFTKNHEAREVRILKTRAANDEYSLFVFMEIPKSRVSNMFSVIQKLYEDNHVGIGIYSAGAQILLQANQQYLNFFPEPYNREDLAIGTRVEELIVPWNGSQVQAIWEGTLKQNKSMNITEMKRLDQGLGARYCDKLLVPVAEKGKVKFVVSILWDVTQRVASRQKVEEQSEIIFMQKNQLYNIINTLHIPLLRISYPDMCVTELNRKAFEVINDFNLCAGGYENINVSGKSLFDLLKAVDRNQICKCVYDAVENKKTTRMSNVEITSKDNRCFINIVYQPVLDSNNNISELLIMFLDVTAEVKGRMDVERVLKMKEEFFSFISHEFKTPLSVINAAIQAIENTCGTDVSPKVKSYLDRIRQNSLRQLRLVNNLLDITKAEAGYITLQKANLDIVALTKSITESVIVYARGKGVELEFVSSVPEKIIGIDEEKYERVLLNLLSNAIKFTPPGSKVYVGITLKKNRLCVEVKDEGIGIPHEKRKSVFEPFKQLSSNLTRNSEGTGIGLTLVKLLVELMGGEIKLDSEVGKGSTFSIYIPCSKVTDNILESQMLMSADKRILQAAAIEFSHIYLHNDQAVPKAT